MFCTSVYLTFVFNFAEMSRIQILEWQNQPSVRSKNCRKTKKVTSVNQERKIGEDAGSRGFSSSKIKLKSEQKRQPVLRPSNMVYLYFGLIQSN